MSAEPRLFRIKPDHREFLDNTFSKLNSHSLSPLVEAITPEIAEFEDECANEEDA